MTDSRRKCAICGLYDAYRKCLYCHRDICSAETCVVAYVGGTQEDRVVCLSCA
jgi:hypothetical protein